MLWVLLLLRTARSPRCVQRSTVTQLAIILCCSQTKVRQDRNVLTAAALARKNDETTTAGGLLCDFRPTPYENASSLSLSLSLRRWISCIIASLNCKRARLTKNSGRNVKNYRAKHPLHCKTGGGARTTRYACIYIHYNSKVCELFSKTKLAVPCRVVLPNKTKTIICEKQYLHCPDRNISAGWGRMQHTIEKRATIYIYPYLIYVQRNNIQIITTIKK